MSKKETINWKLGKKCFGMKTTGLLRICCDQLPKYFVEKMKVHIAHVWKIMLHAFHFGEFVVSNAKLHSSSRLQQQGKQFLSEETFMLPGTIYTFIKRDNEALFITFTAPAEPTHMIALSTLVTDLTCT